MENEIIQLEKKVEELTLWKNNLIEERLKFPIGIQTEKEIRRDAMIFIREVSVALDTVYTDLIAFGMEIEINKSKNKRVVFASFPILTVTVDATTNVFTYTGSNAIKDGELIAFTTTNTLPNPLDPVVGYYIISSTFSTFKVSLTQGGAEVDITDIGVGTHYFAIIS